jgi:predicted dinucleotide-binding enzyme
MRIGMMGAGNVGGTLGKAWQSAGHEVRFGTRHPGDDPTKDTPEAVAAWADVIVFAVPGASTADVATTVASHLAGKTVIDATNRPGAPTLHSLADLAAAAPTARLSRAFSTVGWEVMADPRFDGDRADLFYCGVEEDRTVLEQLIEDVGFRPVWVGGPGEADVVDGLTRAWFALVFRRGLGRHLALRLLGA